MFVQELKRNWLNWLIESFRTSLAAMFSLGVAQLLKVPTPYWAPIITLIVMQSTLGASWEASKPRIIGTALGAVIGALLLGYFSSGIALFGAAVFILGLICCILRLNQSAYRFAAITTAIIMLTPHAHTIWVMGIYRFADVLLGIITGLFISAIWPGRAAAD